MADPKERPVEDEPGIGILPDGKLDVVDAAEYRQRVLDRDAQNDDALPVEDLDDVSDLEDDDGET